MYYSFTDELVKLSLRTSSIIHKTRNFIIGPTWVNDLSVNSVYSDIHKWDIPLKQTTYIITINMIVTLSFSWHLQIVIRQP